MSQLIDNTFTSDDTAILKTSLAYDGDSRSEGEVHPVKIKVNLAGVSVRDLVEKALAQKAVEFQRPRRSADKGGTMESKEQFDQYIEDVVDANDGVLEMHFSQIGSAPAKVKTPEELEAESDAIASQMSDEQLQAQIEKLQARLGK